MLHVSEMYCKDAYLQKDLPKSYFWGIYVHYKKFSRVIKLLKFYFFSLLHLLVAAYRGVFKTWSNIYNGAFFVKILKGTVMQIEKGLINHRLRVSKISSIFRIPTIHNFAVIYPMQFICNFLKSSLLFISFYCLFCL